MSVEKRIERFKNNPYHMRMKDLMDIPDNIPLMEKCFALGYAAAVNDYGIWKDGKQTIGCMGCDVKEIIDEVLD